MPLPCPASPTCECSGSKLSQSKNSGPHTKVVFCGYGCCKSQLAPKKIPFDGIPGVSGYYPRHLVVIVLHPKQSSLTEKYPLVSHPTL